MHARLHTFLLSPRLLLAASLLLAAAGTPAAAQPAIGTEAPTAVFDVELYDTSLEGMNPALAERLKLASAEFRKLIDASGKYRTIDLSPQAAEIEQFAPLYQCNGCDMDIAADLGADIAFSAVVHKISTLILKIQIVGRDVKTGEAFIVAGADIRGDNDTAWLHGFRWLARNKLDL